MRTAVALVTALLVLAAPIAATDPKSQFFTASDGGRIHCGETHGSVHLNPAYTAALVKSIIDSHSR